MNDQVRLTLEEVHASALEALTANTVSGDHARAIAGTVTAAERDGCKSHGLSRLPGYVASMRSGKVTPAAKPVVRELAAGTAAPGARRF